jgi:hypothetical protein
VFRTAGILRITIPDKVRNLPEACFAECIYLQEVLFTEQSELQEIGKWAFLRSQLRKIVIPASVSCLGFQCFSYCLILTSVAFAQNSQLVSIKESAFRWCTSLTNLSLPATVKQIGRGVFHKCKAGRELGKGPGGNYH